MRCIHGVPYPLDGTDQAKGPWVCNSDGSNPNCDECGPDDWAESIYETASDTNKSREAAPH